MLKLLLALHLVFAVFAIGPLVHAATTAGRGIRRATAPPPPSSSRMLRIYAYVSVLVVIAGMGLMSQKRTEKKAGAEVRRDLDLAVAGALGRRDRPRAPRRRPHPDRATQRSGQEASVVSLDRPAWPRPGGVVALIFPVIVVTHGLPPRRLIDGGSRSSTPRSPVSCAARCCAPAWPVDRCSPATTSPTPVHLAAMDGDEGSSAPCVLFPRPYPLRPTTPVAWQLRGMATAAHRRSQGVGALVLQARRRRGSPRHARLRLVRRALQRAPLLRAERLPGRGLPEFLHPEPDYRTSGCAP